MSYYLLCLQCKDYFKILGIIKMNNILFVASFFIVLLALNKLSINTAIQISLLSYSLTSKISFKRISGVFKFLSIIYKRSLERTFGIN